MKRGTPWVVAGMIVLVLSSDRLFGQVPGPLEPSRPSEDLAPPLKPRAEPGPPASITREQAPPERAGEISFVLKAVRLQGAEALREEQLSDLWAAHIGKTVTLSTVFDIVNAITRRYAEAGYALSVAVLPEQKIEDGVVAIRVVEGYVDEIVFVGDSLEGISGSRDGSGGTGFLARYAEGIKRSRPLRTADLERYLLLMNDLPGVAARATFAASPKLRGASTMTIHIARKAVEGQAGINNHLPRNLGRTRAGGALWWNGPINGGDRLRFEGWRSVSGDAYGYAAMEYAQVVGDEGLRLGLNLLYSDTEPDNGLLSNLDYLGRYVAASVSAEYPLIRSRGRNLSLSAAFTVSKARSELLDAPLTKDRIRAASFYATYDFAESSGAVNLLRVGVQQGLNVLGATGDGNPLRSRANGSATFTSLDFRGLRTQPLARNVSLYLEASAQAALDDPLLSGAECAYGGRLIGRGYQSGALSGDHCVMGLVELRWTPPVAERTGVQLYGFADAGLARQKGSLPPGERRERHASSFGGGVRIFFTEKVLINLEVVKPTKAKYTEDDRTAPRIMASLIARF